MGGYPGMNVSPGDTSWRSHVGNHALKHAALKQFYGFKPGGCRNYAIPATLERRTNKSHNRRLVINHQNWQHTISQLLKRWAGERQTLRRDHPDYCGR